jgi:hypothetical protein
VAGTGGRDEFGDAEPIVGGREEQQPTGRCRQPVEPGPVRAAQHASGRQPGRQRSLAAALRGGQRPGEVRERLRVAAGQVHERARRVGRKPTGHQVVEQLAARGQVQAGDPPARDARHRGPVAARGEHEHGAVRAEPAGHERERVDGGGVEQVRIVDATEHDRALRGVGYEAQHGR